MKKELTHTISIIIPVYNTERYVERCLYSVLNQSYRDLEVIVVNDCSPGNIDELMQPILEQDPRVRYLRHEKNRGLFRARVTGMAAASGDYVAFLDSDDYISYDFYRSLLSRAVETGSEIVIGKTVWEENGGKYVYNLHDSCFQFDVLEGDAVKTAYFSQEASCYSWHTVWNKLYKKSLIDRCFGVFDRIPEHIIMTEDICFSSVFFYEAQQVSRVKEEAYFYCTNEDASTNTSSITIARFKKNVGDMTLVFRAVERFLEEKEASGEIREHFHNARLHYVRMWRNLLQTTFTGRELEAGKQAMEAFGPVCTTDHVRDDFFFESIRTPWNGALEYFKERIGKGEEEYISFDIFDTLILRPFYTPEDLMVLLDPIYRKLSGSNAQFSQLRRSGEELARKQHYERFPEHQDITLTEIYDFIAEHYGIDSRTVKRMQQAEVELELRFAEIRPSGRSLYEMAQAAGKKIVLVTDMYLEEDTIRSILKKNGYTGYERLYVSSAERRLKYTGDLFRCVLRDYPDAAGKVVHIGDTWQSDIEGSGKVGFASFFLPKSRELFEGRIAEYQTNRCAVLGDRISSSFVDYAKMRKNMGLRSMLAVVYQKYFDRPYRPFHPESDLNADPWFIGYYLVGMHLMGLCKWIDSKIGDAPEKTIHFLSRDGYLPMQAYACYCKHTGRKVRLSYLQTSRKALMPLIAKDPAGFYQLPVEFRAHTPLSLLKLLAYAGGNIPEEDACRFLHGAGIDPMAYISDTETYDRVIRIFLDEIYDEGKHRESCMLLKQYFAQIRPGDVTFDLGYSGRIQAAISDACGFGVDALFVHEDYLRSVDMRSYAGFGIDSFYDFHPIVSGLFREHLLSDWGGSCVGYRRNGDRVVSVNEPNCKYKSDSLVIGSIHQGALDFMEDYLSRFGDLLPELDYSPMEVSLPLEEYLRHPSGPDLQIFGCSYFEDEVYGGRRELNIEQFLREQTWRFDTMLLRAVPASMAPPAAAPAGEQPIWNRTLVDIMRPRSKLVRALLWLLIDFESFKERFVVNIRQLLRK